MTPAASHKGHHRRTSSLWRPPTRPVLSNGAHLIREKAETSGRALKQLIPFSRWIFDRGPRTIEFRTIDPNNLPEAPPRYEQSNPKFATNRICTTKYSPLTFFPKNLFEQFHRLANVYFVFIVILNWEIGLYGRMLAPIPIVFVLAVTAIKDALEDYRRYKSDQKINHQTCRVWDSREKRYRKMFWKHILVGDFVHLSHDEIIPADMLLLRSSDPSGICYVETSNLDGETNLKQRVAIQAMAKYHSPTVPLEFSPENFNYKVIVEEPTEDLHRFEGRLEVPDGEPPLARENTLLSKNNVLLRGCMIKNTDFVEGLVIYAGSETKAMLNNSGTRYKRSSLEKLANWDIIWCVLILLILCLIGAVLSAVWVEQYKIPDQIPFLVQIFGVTGSNYPGRVDLWSEGWHNFLTFIIALQVMIPISLYVSIEIIKLGQIWLICNDSRLYYEKKDKKMECRALNIPEELGQIQYVMSDKTGTLTENQMIFRRCSVAGKDFGGMSVVSEESSAKPLKEGISRDRGLENLIITGLKNGESVTSTSPIVPLFLTMSICNTVVVNSKPHEDLMDEEGEIITSPLDKNKSQRDFGADKPKQQVHFAASDENQTPGRNTPDSLDSIELMEINTQETNDRNSLGSLKDVKEIETRFDEEEEKEIKEEKTEKKEETKTRRLPGILSKSPTSLLNLSSRLKNFTPFKRNSSKGTVSITSGESPPVLSFYDSESPDELALVEAAREYGVRLLKRHFDEIIVYTRTNSNQMRFKLLHTLAFDADRKRMSVIVREIRNNDSNREGPVVLLCKGADTTILPLLSEEFCTSEIGGDRVHMAQLHLSDYARQGLRTLCLVRKVLLEEEYQAWRAQHEEAELAVHGKEERIALSAASIEKDFELLGVTAIEDRLQDGVPECIQALREAGIQVWVLTGDKSETAINIAYSTRLFFDSMDLLNIQASGIRAVSDLIDLYLERTERRSTISTFGLVLNGPCLDCCFDPFNLDRFINLLKRCRSVLCCRSTPLQKAALVNLAKHHLKGKVLAIGDGANDVSMIQGADVGVGLSGQEGMQAVMASDYAMARFRFLAPLLLVHGHWCYNRLANTILYFFYKNAMFVFVIFWYQIFCGFSSQSNMDPFYLLVYNLLFTSVPPLLYGFLEQDASYDMLLENPAFYDAGRLGKKYKWYSFWLNMLDAVWQSAVVFWIAYGAYEHAKLDIWTLGTLQCAQLLLANSVHLALISQYWAWPLLLSLVGSIIFFCLFAAVYNLLPVWLITSMLNVADPPIMIFQRAVMMPRFWLVLLLSTVLCMTPRLTWIAIRNTYHPSRALVRRIETKEETQQSQSPTYSFNRERIEINNA
ncbi:unnamed protein product, partial [Mesorhabditis belari]|uniref:Phospholipid-transporting ATPase n=1 Tax=Mesorhabditis belari TaxID=2138241 RepID=A0AAF3EBN7_9BILA